MPLRSRTSPMNVKNGIASRVEFAMMPRTRSGSAWRSEGWSRPSCMPTTPKNKPFAASENATG